MHAAISPRPPSCAGSGPGQRVEHGDLKATQQGRDRARNDVDEHEEASSRWRAARRAPPPSARQSRGSRPSPRSRSACRRRRGSRRGRRAVPPALPARSGPPPAGALIRFSSSRSRAGSHSSRRARSNRSSASAFEQPNMPANTAGSRASSRHVLRRPPLVVNDIARLLSLAGARDHLDAAACAATISVMSSIKAIALPSGTAGDGARDPLLAPSSRDDRIEARASSFGRKILPSRCASSCRDAGSGGVSAPLVGRRVHDQAVQLVADGDWQERRNSDQERSKALRVGPPPRRSACRPCRSRPQIPRARGRWRRCRSRRIRRDDAGHVVLSAVSMTGGANLRLDGAGGPVVLDVRDLRHRCGAALLLKSGEERLSQPGPALSNRRMRAPSGAPRGPCLGAAAFGLAGSQLPGAR